MTSFRRYDHLVRLGHAESAGIADGRVYVFPKLDGTNASVWLDETGRLQCGSRNRVLSIESDNAGFCAWANSDDPKAVALRAWLTARYVVYGEWLVPHTVKTYRAEAWKRLWVFDVWDRVAERYVAFDDYCDSMRKACIDLIEPLCIITNPSINQLIAQAETNSYLVQDGAGVGEGIVLKNYDWTHDGKQPWAKIVRNEFKEKAQRAFGTTEKQGEFQVEVAIADEFCTATLVGKTRAKVVTAVASHHGIDMTAPNAQQLVEASFRHNVIPQLLGRVWNDLIAEEMWEILKKHKNPTIDFGRLQSLVIRRIKVLAQDLFGTATVDVLRVTVEE